MSNPVEQLLMELEDTSALLSKAQINLRKCPKQRLTRGYIESRLKTIEEYWIKFTQAHQTLLRAIPKEQKNEIPYFANEEFYVYEELYLCLQGDLKDLLLTITSKSSGVVMSPHGSSANIEEQVKLPRIVLPTFSGVYEDWPAFQDLFTSLVHNKASLSQVQKLHYLKCSLVGEAASLLKHIQVTEGNYTQAWTLLKGRFGNKRLIVNSLLKKLFMQRKMPAQTANHIKSLLDTTRESINSLQNLNISTVSWDPLIIFLVTQKLDPDTHRDWEEHAYKDNSDELPQWEELAKFLESKYRTMELITPPARDRVMRTKEYAVHVSSELATSKQRICAICKENHTLCHCREFIKMNPVERSEYVKSNNLCFNCLAPGHSAKRCKLNMSCRICHKKHHTMVHQASQKPTTYQPDNFQALHNEVQVQYNQVPQQHEVMSSHFTTKSTTALLATALVPVRSETGQVTVLRALIDHGSQATFISERAAQILRIKRMPINGTITGVGSTKTVVKHACTLELLSRHEETFKLTVTAYIMPTRLTTLLPSRTLKIYSWSHLDNLTLSDPTFYQAGRIDLLLGVEVCAQIMKTEIIKGPPGSPCAQNTSLGWILFGNVQEETHRENISVMHVNLDLDKMLKAMWELDTTDKKSFTIDEKRCQEIYETTHARTKDGRYIVKLPTKTENLLSTQAETKPIALRRLHQLERRLEKEPNLRKEYVDVMEEYLSLQHMEEVPVDEVAKPSVYLAHHAVIKSEKETSKVRPVFDASQKGLNGVSLNDELLIGPQLNNDMRSLIMKWRMKKICFVADIKQMYRQVLVTKADKDLQRVLWRSNVNDPVKDYRLTRVTFGTACAPYLAVKTLQQTAEDEGKDYPDAAKIIKEDFYVDDLMSGKDTVEAAVTVAKNVAAILKKGGFILQKWCSNNANFLKEFDPTQRSTHVNIKITVDGIIRALGLKWNMGKDVFQYELNLPPSGTVTKRTILADVQRLFDPLGWLAPAILPAKLMIQQLWLNGVSWDQELDSETASEWVELRDSLQAIEKIEVPRWQNTLEERKNQVSIHGFSDASIKAYSAVAYLRVILPCGQIVTSIVAAKTRVAPIKPVSLPRLELCGAVLLSRLLKQIKEAINIPDEQIFAWSDSTIVLSWLQGDPARWHTFVRNRVVEILENIGKNWYHVRTKDNPADVASRGEDLLKLKENKQWWKGPEWLSKEKINFSKMTNQTTNLEAKDTINVNLNVKEAEDNFTKQFANFENLTDLLKSISYCKRFLNAKWVENKATIITTKELDEALKACVRIAQRETFKEEIDKIRKTRSVRRDSKLKSLLPYLDEDEVLRVGGRLRNANIDEDKKHPMILHGKSTLTSLIVHDAHLKTLHGGVQLMLGYIRSKFWIIRAKDIVKKTIHKCLICARQSAAVKSQQMGDLPSVRVTPARCFLNAAVDFTGSFEILPSRGKGIRTTKAYVAVFVCMATKAIHLELTGDLTSDSFIGAFKRFTARRGKCAHIWSDQGRNFIGANKELAETFRQANLDYGSIAQTLALDGTEWHFIPAYSPHIGGLWEAGVKSVKFHLKRIVHSHLTYEEMSTLLCQIEACLNSRPLYSVDDQDSNQVTVLTPGHFLIGEAPIVIPHPDLSHIPVSHLSRWQYMQKLTMDFWKIWQREYLTRLQQRPKWQRPSPELDVGCIVLIKMDNLPPGKWAMGRIVAKHPGPDGLTRIYSVKSGDKITQRAITKLCPLPIDYKSQERN